MTRSGLSRALLLCLTLLTASGFAVWLYMLDGTRGLLEWMPEYRPVFHLIFLVAAIPFTLACLALLLARFGHTKPAKILFTVMSVLALLISLAFLALFGTLLYKTRVVPENHSALSARSLPGNKPVLKLAFSSDPHIGSPGGNPQKTTRILQTVNDGDYDAFFVLGDIVEMGMPGNNFEEAYALFKSNLTTVPLITVMGNHDSLIGGSFRYKAMFNDRQYYRIDAGTTHIIALNLLWGTESLDSSQLSWLKENLASIPQSDTTIVISHCFFWASGYVDSSTGKDWFDHPSTTSRLSPILERGGVDLVVSGHNHFMEYLEGSVEGNTAYVVIGSMGGRLDSVRTYQSSHSRWFRGDQFGFLELTVGADGMELTFRNEVGEELYKIQR